MMNTMVGASKDLLDLQAKKKKLLEQQPDANAQQITNHLFVGSTADLQKMVENIKNNKHEKFFK
jgi:peptidoglycan hydrolase CwlO-like protein